MKAINWITLKSIVDSKKLQLFWIELEDSYWLTTSHGPLNFECILAKTDASDFETNYKPLGPANIRSTINIDVLPAIASKTLGAKKLYKRVVGVQSAVTTGSTDIVWTCPFAWVKFMGIEFTNCESLDKVSLYVLDKAATPLFGVPNATLNQFGFDANMCKDFYKHQSEFDADIYGGLQIKIVYTSVSDKTVGINFIMNEVKD